MKPTHPAPDPRHSAQILSLLKRQGYIKDPSIRDEQHRQAEQAKRKKLYHNTTLLLQHYRDIRWALECFPEEISEELGHPLHDLDSLLNLVSDKLDWDNRKLEERLRGVQQSRLLLERVNESLSVLKQKPRDGMLMYNVIYQTYITPEKLSHTDILYRVGISSRHYYRNREQAIHVLSICLWATPSAELDTWIEVLTLLDEV